MAKAVICVVQSSNGLIWGAAFDRMKAQEKINELKEIYDGEFYITTAEIIDVEVRV